MSNTDTNNVTIDNGNSEVKDGASSDNANSPKVLVTETNTPWSNYLNSLNSKYQDRIKKAAQQSIYSITIRNENGSEVKQQFTRMKMLQYQFEEVEDLRAQSSELSASNKPREGTKLLSQMYRKAAGYILWNTKEERPMTDDEYRHSVFSEVRPALDASMLLGLISDPN